MTKTKEINSFILGFGEDSENEVYVLTSDSVGPTGNTGKIYKIIPHGISNAPIWIIEFKERKMVKTFLREIGFVRKIPEIIERKWEHSPSNSVKLDSDNLKKHLVKYPRKYRHLFRFLKCSKNIWKKLFLILSA